MITKTVIPLVNDKHLIVSEYLHGASMLSPGIFRGPLWRRDSDTGDTFLDREVLHRVARNMKVNGANACRDFCFWPLPWELTIDYTIDMMAPMTVPFDHRDDFKSLVAHHKEVAKVMNGYGIRYIVSLFDYCGTKQRKVNSGHGKYSPGDYNPWGRVNARLGDEREYIPWYLKRQTKLDMIELQYITQMCTSLKGYDVMLDICNEPGPEIDPLFLAFVFRAVVKNGIPFDRIISPYDIYLKEFKGGKYASNYKVFRDHLVKNKIISNRELKSQVLHPWHGLDMKQLDEVSKGPKALKPGGTRRILYSTDGSDRMTKEEIKDLVDRLYKLKRNSAKAGNVNVGVIYGKTHDDPIDSIAGASAAYTEFFKRPPSNFNKDQFIGEENHSPLMLTNIGGGDRGAPVDPPPVDDGGGGDDDDGIRHGNCCAHTMAALSVKFGQMMERITELEDKVYELERSSFI